VSVRAGIRKWDLREHKTTSLLMEQLSMSIVVNRGFGGMRLLWGWTFEMWVRCVWGRLGNDSEPSGHYIYRQFNIQQFYVLSTQ
jgi:hypothetical protein